MQASTQMPLRLFPLRNGAIRVLQGVLDRLDLKQTHTSLLVRTIFCLGRLGNIAFADASLTLGIRC